jgi:hypothetical protein
MHVHAARHHEPASGVDHLTGIFHRQRVRDSRNPSARKTKVTCERVIRRDDSSVFDHCIELQSSSEVRH